MNALLVDFSKSGPVETGPYAKHTHLGLWPLLPDPLTQGKQDSSGGRWWALESRPCEHARSLHPVACGPCGAVSSSTVHHFLRHMAWKSS